MSEKSGSAFRVAGKSGGGRAIYLVLEVDDMLVLLKAYGKNEQDDLSTAQRREVLAIIERL
ncbi:MAG: RelE toxin of RelE / RelB toxin-antitoxin system [Caulobacteraceae bacterium]|nr:RelE toxin of RelE / RelB toxin-antitoxin system [Caulobacteraceae bacterium]